MERSMPGLPVHQQLLEFTQTHVHWVGDAIQPPHPVSSPSPPTFNLSQHQGLFQWVSSLHQVANLLEFQLQHQSFQLIFRTDFLYDGLVGSPCSPSFSQESSPTPPFKSINSSAHTSYRFIQRVSVCQNISGQNDNWQLWLPSLQNTRLNSWEGKAHSRIHVRLS